MKKYFYILAAIGCLSLAATANAQLPANPWSPNPNDGYFGDNLPEKGPDTSPNAPAYENGPTNGDILPVDPGPAPVTAAASLPGEVPDSTAN